MNNRIIEYNCSILFDYLTEIEHTIEDIEEKLDDLKEDFENDNIDVDDFDLDEISDIKSNINAARSHVEVIFENIL